MRLSPSILSSLVLAASVLSCDGVLGINIIAPDGGAGDGGAPLAMIPDASASFSDTQAPPPDDSSSQDAGGPIGDTGAPPLDCPDAEAVCNAACADLSTDLHNCGSCGTFCSGECQAGKCLTILALQLANPGRIVVDHDNAYWDDNNNVLSAPIAGGTTTTLVTGETGLWGLAIDPWNLYWVTSDNYVLNVMSYSLGRGTVSTLASGPGSAGGSTDGELATNATTVYWTDSYDNAVMSVPLVTAPVTVSGGDEGVWESVAVNSTNVYWLDTSGRLMTAPLPSGAPTALAVDLDDDPTLTTDCPGQIVLDATSVYWRDEYGKVLSVPLAGAPDGGAPVTLAAGQSGASIAIDATNVYWTDSVTDGGILTAPLTGVPDGGAPTTVASGQTSPNAIAVRDGTVYWTNALSDETGTVMSLSLDGGAPTELVSGTQGALCNAFAVDATSIYWSAFGGNILKAPRAGGAPVTLATGQGPSAATGLAVDDESVYWTNFITGNVMRVPLRGGASAAIATAQPGPFGIAVLPGQAGAPTSLYWLNEDDSMVVSATLGGPAKVVANANNPTDLAISATNLYWGNEGNGTLMMVPLSGGSGEPVASGQGLVGLVRTDDTNVYWRTTSNILQAPLNGGTITTIGTTKYLPTTLEVDGTNVYYAQSIPGFLMKTPVGGGSLVTLNSQMVMGAALDDTSVYWTTASDCIGSFRPCNGFVYRLTPK